MPDPRLLAIVTALLLISGGSAARAEYSLRQLQDIEGYILRKDCGGLWQYLVENPSIMAGGDALAAELRVFVNATQRGQLDCFDAPSEPVAVLPQAPVVNFAPNAGALY